MRVLLPLGFRKHKNRISIVATDVLTYHRGRGEVSSSQLLKKNSGRITGVGGKKWRKG